MKFEKVETSVLIIGLILMVVGLMIIVFALLSDLKNEKPDPAVEKLGYRVVTATDAEQSTSIDSELNSRWKENFSSVQLTGTLEDEQFEKDYLMFRNRLYETQYYVVYLVQVRLKHFRNGSPRCYYMEMEPKRVAIVNRYPIENRMLLLGSD